MPLRMITTALWIAMLLPLFTASSSHAELEITPMIGFRTGSTEVSTGIVCTADITSPCPSFTENDDGPSYGLIVDFGLSRDWMFEVLLNRQNGDLEVDPIICEACSTVDIIGELEIDTLQIGLKRRWQKGRVHPFAAFGVGFSSLSYVANSFGFIDLDEDPLSVSLAAGIQIPMTDRLGLRFEARGYWLNVSDDAGPFFDDLVQTEIAGGLSFTW